MYLKILRLKEVNLICENYISQKQLPLPEWEIQHLETYYN